MIQYSFPSRARFFGLLYAPILWATLFLMAPLLLTVTLAGPAYAGSDKIPRVLSDKDINRYREIIDLQNDAKWGKADKLIKRLDNDLLIGHLLFQRYMHPTGYRSNYKELRDWMQHYADLPGAQRIYNLARTRQGRAAAPKRPSDTRYPGVTGQSARAAKATLPKRTRAEARAVSKFKSNVQRYVGLGLPERAEKRYHAIAERGLLSAVEAAAALERIAASYYYKGDDFKALALAKLATDYSRPTEPAADWIAGLASWRQDDIHSAYGHFDALSKNEHVGRWLKSAGHFWAARAARRLGQTKDTHTHLIEASKESETFYGLIAARQLGRTLTYDWQPPELTNDALNHMLKRPAALRAIALTEIGRDDLADEELRLLWGREGIIVQDQLLAFASALNLPAIQVRLGRAGGTGKATPAAIRYPLPDWEPIDGLRVDRALLYAMVRQESDFRSRARSHVGARGLMQVMPATASFITRDRSLFKRNKNRLYEPEFNMALGQQYIEHLLDADYVEGNLFMLLAAYNGGPGSLLTWRREVNYAIDPLLFIESIGFHQTRHYIERVMANMWLYRIRLGQDTPSLDAVASGAWPPLDHLDTPEARKIREHRAARLAARTRNYYED